MLLQPEVKQTKLSRKPSQYRKSGSSLNSSIGIQPPLIQFRLPQLRSRNHSDTPTMSNPHSLLSEDHSWNIGSQPKTPPSTQSPPSFQPPSPFQSPLQHQLSLQVIIIPSSALALILKTYSVPEAHAHLWEPSRALPPIASQVNNPPTPKWKSPVPFQSNRHSANSKTSQGLRWLLVTLEQHRTTSWDMVTASRLWSQTRDG
jgi:hypothetical protein